MTNIRNFCIIAHIDHGKSTLADRLLEFTGTIEKRKMKEQILDSMELERERGITIKLTPARMKYKDYILNLIDTPGHVDFTYEVSRSLAAVEGALLLVDTTQGVQAQTLGNLYLALEQNLVIIPVVNKIDLPNADVKKTKEEIVKLVGCREDEILLTSGKTGQGVEIVLEAIIERIPEPKGSKDAEIRALIFDSKYDEYRGVVAYIRLVDGSLKKGDKIKFFATGAETEILEIGYFAPDFAAQKELCAGEIGYIVTTLKNIEGCRVGDTVILSSETSETKSRDTRLPGYKEVKPMVFAGFYPKEGQNAEKLREAMGKLKLNDAAMSFEPERNTVLGFGFRVGFLGLLHLEITKERLKREYGINLIVTVPSVAYKIFTKGRNEPTIIKSTAELPDPSTIERIEDPYVLADIITPKEYLGQIMKICEERRGEYKNIEYLGGENPRVILHYNLPLSVILVDFYDKLKSASQGYASLNYEITGFKPNDIVQLNILINGDSVEELSTLVYRDESYRRAREIAAALKKAIPRQMIEVKIQAAIGGKIVAAERIAPFRKDVLAKLYGGDVTRKMKLLKKQKEGKKKMLGKGQVNIPTDAYLSVLKRE